MVNVTLLASFSAVAYVLYLVALAVYRLFFSRISHIPGPKLAALTYYYQSYYDLWPHSGQFLFHCRDLHKQYGPIIRIGPDEATRQVHALVLDGRHGRYNARWFYLCDNGPFLHRLRRMAISPFFSKKMVQELEPRVKSKVELLKKRVLEYAGTEELLDLCNACSGLTLDIITEYAFGESIGALELPDMGKEMNQIMRDGSRIHAFARTFPTLTRTMVTLPPWALPQTDLLKAQIRFRDQTESMTRKAWNEAKADSAKGKEKKVSSSERTVMHSVINSDSLPPEERTLKRLSADGSILLGAGTETTGRTLAMTFYHILAKRDVLERLLAELRTVMPTSQSPLPSAATLEKLPYLTAVITEGTRIAHGVAGRLVRIAPDEDLQYGGYRIPRGVTFSQSPYLYHTNPKTSPDPFAFKPDRFLGPDASQAYKHLAPFGRGTRACLGLNLAYSELYLTIAALIAGVNMELVDTTERDATIVSEHFIGCLPEDSKGIRVKVLGER